MGKPRGMRGRSDQVKMSFLKCSRELVGFVFFLTAVSGCSVVDSFQPEVVRIEGGEISIKGWVDLEKSRFCADIRLKPDAKNVTLHSLNLVLPDGTKLAPDSWKDQTPKPSSTGVSFGFGFGGGGRRGRHHPDDYDDGGGGGGRSMITPGVSIPLNKKDSTRSVTRGRACWTVDDRLGGADITKCDLEVNLARVEREEITLTTLLLAMGYHPEEKPKEEKPVKQTSMISEKIGRASCRERV